jgi:signal transduction histidine kinase
MAIIQQIIELLSQPPGSVIYHLITLFALQVVLALAFSHWHRDPNDEAARRMTFAAGGILVARLLLLFIGLMVEGDPLRARITLPPIEQAIDMATVLLLVWGLTPIAEDRPRLADGVILVSLVIVAVMCLFFFQDWQSRVGDGGVTTAYLGTVQAYVWGVLQLAVLVAGLVWLLWDRGSRLTLRPIIVVAVLLAHVANFFNYPEIIPTGTEVVYWLRLGYLVAFPLWAVLAYQDSMRDLMTADEADRSQAAQLARHLRLSTDVIRARIPEVRLDQALDMAAGLVPVQFAAIGLIDERNPQQVVFSRFRPPVSRDPNYARQFNLADHAAFRMAYEQQRGIELEPRGVGARQAHELSQQFNVGALGPVFVEPLLIGNHCLGFLMLAAPPTISNWADRDRAIIPHLAAFLAQAIGNSYRHEGELNKRAATPSPFPAARPAERVPENERLILELAEARRMLTAAEERARQSETLAVFLQQSKPGQPTTAMPQVAQAAVGPAVEKTIGKILPIIRRKNLKLDLAIADELALVAVKEGVLRQLALSLLENACRASLEDGRVLVRAEMVTANGGGPARARSVALMVTDSGTGINPDDRERVFGASSAQGGERPIAGLGVSSGTMGVVQKLAQASGGDLNFDSVVGQGATFTLRLPAAEVQPWTLMKINRAGQSDEAALKEIASAGDRG